jgi:3-oxosteroid 1-dehydrogenase
MYASEVNRCDLVVIGSGSAGLMTALTAANLGLSVTVLEKGAVIGGTTAISGAGLWIPGNHLARAAGVYDSAEDCYAYIRSTAPVGWEEKEAKRWRAFCENAPIALQLLEDLTPLQFGLLDLPDIFLDHPGAKRHGRVVSPRLLDLRRAGVVAARIRKPKYPHLFTFQEILGGVPLGESGRAKIRSLTIGLWRYATKRRAMGTALVAGLLSGALDHGVSILTNACALDLIVKQERVIGVKANINGTEAEIAAERGIVLAAGGFEWDLERLERHFPGPRDYIASPRTNTGDGHRMAESVGAQLDLMDQANMHPLVPGRYDGMTQGIGFVWDKVDSAIVVDANGLRFGDEHDANMALRLDERGPDGRPIHLPAWMITDRSFLREQRFARWVARRERGWIRRGRTLAELADKIGVSASALQTTVDSYNGTIVQKTRDPFGRVDRALIQGAPYLAIPYNRSFISTKGGPRTDECARVMRGDGSTISGLYCVGVGMANPLGTKAIGGCTTLGPNITWGYIAAKHAATRAV